MSKRLLQAMIVAVLAGVMLGADGKDARFSRVGHQMMCVCSCGQVLLECNHVGCPDSDRMITELRDQMAGSSDDRTILNWFTQKYGATVLAAPIRGGFDTVAWITPLVFFIVAILSTGFIIRSWTSRRGSASAASWSNSDVELAQRTRIRRETEL